MGTLTLLPAEKLCIRSQRHLVETSLSIEMRKTDKTKRMKMSRRNWCWQETHFNGILKYILRFWKHEEQNVGGQSKPREPWQLAKASKSCSQCIVIYTVRRQQAVQSSHDKYFSKKRNTLNLNISNVVSYHILSKYELPYNFKFSYAFTGAFQVVLW